jgi:hypothetical protein
MQRFPSLSSCAFWLAVFLLASTQGAKSQRCPPNSHPEAVAIPGNLRTAQCFCDRGFTRVDGVCVPVRRPADRLPPNDPARQLVAPYVFR